MVAASDAIQMLQEPVVLLEGMEKIAGFILKSASL